MNQYRIQQLLFFEIEKSEFERRHNYERISTSNRKIIIATAIIVAANIIAGAIDRAGANIQSGLGYLRDALLR